MSQKIFCLQQLDPHTKFLLACFSALILIFACAKGRLGGNWAVPKTQISEGEGNGDIPAINEPKFTKAAEVTFLTDTSIIIGIKIGPNIRGYPLELMEWHEVVNDDFDGIPFAITYSTLSGSSIAFDRRIKEQILEFRVSGLLFNSNTIFNELETFTDWSQMLKKGIRGDYTETTLNTYPVFEMNWLKWKQLFPDADVLNINTGFNRPYGVYPYGDYRTDSTQILFDLPLNIDSLNEVLPLKEKILGVKVNEIVKGYRFANFTDQGFSLIEDEIEGIPIIVLGSKEFSFLQAYNRTTESNEILSFSLEETVNGVQLKDNLGNHWNIFGEIIEQKDQKLKKLDTNIAYWFTWATFYPKIEIYL